MRDVISTVGIEFIISCIVAMLGLLVVPTGMHVWEYPSPFDPDFDAKMAEAKVRNGRAPQIWIGTVFAAFLVVAGLTIHFQWSWF